MNILPYTQFDSSEIQQLYTDVFSDSEGPAEGNVIGNLVLNLINTTAPEDIFGYVAADDKQIAGCIFFTRMTFSTPVEAFILSPVAIATNCQGQGIGQTLITYGLEQLKNASVQLAFTYGDPNYYIKTGFKPISEETAKAPCKMTQPEGWLCQALDGGEIPNLPGSSRCVAALNKPGYW